MKQKLRVCEPSPQISMVVSPAVDGFDHLAAERGGRLLAASEPGAVGAVDIVEAGEVGFQAALRPVFLAEHFRDQFLPAVTSFRHGRICVGFFQRADIRILLQVRIVGAGRRGKEIALGAGAPGRLNQVRVDQNAAQALDAKALDEAHAAHVSGQVIDLGGAFDGPDGVFFFAQVHREAIPRRARADTIPAGACGRWHGSACSPNRKSTVRALPR